MKIFCESSVSKRKKNYEHTINKNHIKIQNTVTFEKKKLKINMLKIKNIVTLGAVAIILRNREVLDIAYVI